MDDQDQVGGVALPPTRTVRLIRRIAGPIWQFAGVAAVLHVPRRRSGTIRRVALIPVTVDGTKYLMAFGGVTEWARDLRAAGKGELRHKGRTMAFTAVEVDGE